MYIKIALNELLGNFGAQTLDDMDFYAEYVDYQWAACDIINNLPPETSITADMLHNNNELHESLNYIMNLAMMDGYHSAYYTAYSKAIECLIDDSLDFIDQFFEATIFKGYTIKGDMVTIRVNCRNAGNALIEIINGEGFFGYATVKEFACIYDGRYNLIQAVNQHTHYLFNTKLISDIYGCHRPCIDVGNIYGDVEKESLQCHADNEGINLLTGETP